MIQQTIVQNSTRKNWYKYLNESRIRTSGALNTPTYLQVILWSIAMAAGLGLMIYNFPKYQVGTHFDDAIYIILAKSILFAEKYGLVNFPGEPITWRYPFGYPLLLTPLVKFFPGHLEFYKIISLGATLINASILFWGWNRLNRGFSYWWGLGITVLYLMSPVTIDLSGRVMSEPIFLTFYLLTMLLAEHIVTESAEGNERKPLSLTWPILMGISSAMVLFIRTIGIILVLSIYIYLFIKLRRYSFRPLLWSLLGFTLFLGLIVSTTPVDSEDLLPTKYLTDSQAALLVRLVGGGTSEPVTRPSSQTQDGASGVIENPGLGKLLWDYFGWGILDHFGNHIRKGVFPFGGSDREAAISARLGMPYLPQVIGFGFSIVVIYGYFRWFLRYKVNSFNSSSVLYFIGLFAWVWDDARFLNPIQPQLLTALLLGLQGTIETGVRLVNRNEKQMAGRRYLDHIIPRLIIAFVVITISLSIYKSIIIDDSRLHVGILSERTQWIRQNTPVDAIIMSEYPTLDYLYSDRRTVELHPSGLTADKFIQDMSAKKAGYILVAQRVHWDKPRYIPAYSANTLALLPLLDKLSDEKKINLVYISPNLFVRVYQVIQ